MGGAPAVLRDFSPAHLWLGVTVPGHQPTRDLLDQARAAGVVTDLLRSGTDRSWGRVRLRVLNPPTPDWERRRVRNDDSVVLEVRAGDVSMLLTGDISADVEQMLLPQLEPTPIRLLKVAHHGSRTSSSAVLLDAWRPQIAILSCGRGNRFGHPAPEVLERLHSIGTRVYRTDLDGEVTVETDGRQVRVRTWMEGHK
jgi:competence protein ComEC